MSHQIHITEGIILKKKDLGEADRLFYVYTEKFGMAMVSGKSIRLDKSKLRPNLELFTYGSFALISLGEFWRLVDAREIFSFRANPESLAEIKTFAEIARLALRMIKGEERNEDVWMALKGAFEKIINLTPNPSPEEERGKRIHAGQRIPSPPSPFQEREQEGEVGISLKTLEIQAVASMLKGLGYMETIPAREKETIRAINRAIKESML